MKTQTKEDQAALTPGKSLELLREGNARFQQNLKAHKNHLDQVNITAQGQFPFAVILSCIDSRTSAELIFDQGLGDIFSVRIAGNVINDDILGSMEFACQLAGSMVVVVLGHSSCGAVKGALGGAELGHLTGLLNKIKPAIEQVEGEREGLDDSAFAQRVADANVDLAVEQIRTQSTVLNDMITEGKVGIVGAMYSVQTGAVTFHELVCGSPLSC